MTGPFRIGIWVSTGIYTALLLTASLLPSGTGPFGRWDASISPEWQDALHLPAYAGLVVMWALAWSAKTRLSARMVLAIALACVALGVSMELAQFQIPGRTCSLKDGLVNAAGVLCGCGAIVLLRRSRPLCSTAREASLLDHAGSSLGLTQADVTSNLADRARQQAGTARETPLKQESPRLLNVAMLVTNPGFDDPRVCMEAENLACSGHRVTVVGWDRDSHSDREREQNGVHFVRLELRSTHGRGITQPFFLAGFWMRAWPVLRNLQPAAIHCHDLDTLPLGWLASRSLGSKLVFDAHENFPDMMVGHLPNAVIVLLRRLERLLVPKCDFVITVGNRLADHYRALGAKEVVVVGNWKNPSNYQFASEEVRRARSELGLRNGVIAICFVANLGRERRLGPLLAAVAADKRFACIIGGDGPQADLVKRYAADHANIRYLGRVPPERVPLITAACDVVYYGFDEKNPNAHWSAPNKLYEAIAAGKPVLTGDFGEIGQTVRERACGLIADLSTDAGVTEALKRLAEPGAAEVLSCNARLSSKEFCRRRADSLLLDAYHAISISIRSQQSEGRSARGEG